MNEIWHKINTDNESEEFSNTFWAKHRRGLHNGQFWGDKIKELRGEPTEWLSLAIDNLPLPASFREGVVALRSLIRDKRKKKENFEDELAMLYWLAAINSFSIPYSEVIKGPGYRVIESVPGSKLKNLPFSYASLGYDKLELLNKTDKKWLIELWGEPEQHITLHILHQDVWLHYEAKIKSKDTERSGLSESISKLHVNKSSPIWKKKIRLRDAVKWVLFISSLYLIYRNFFA